MIAPPFWHRIPVDQVAAELSRLNHGTPPRSFGECCDVAAALHWRVMIVPVPEVQALSSRTKHIIQIGQGDDRELFHRCLHELSEIITGRESAEPEYHTDTDERHHDVACHLMEHLQPWFDAERERLETERSVQASIVQQAVAQLDAARNEMRRFLDASEDAGDLHDVTPPDGAALKRLHGEVLREQERLRMIDARLRCL
jgi:hypothetical protein